ncbi:RepB family plasmid replication initiator protein [Pseudoalteromonas ruthenica]|nr:RepB family plasmid replication initiator protein [Pseudoalteromonas ruthenica]
MTSLTQNRKKLVVQSNEITEAAYYLSLKAKRALWMCLSDIKRESGEHDGVFTVKVSDYQNLFGVSGPTASADLKTALSEISRATVKFYPKEGDDEEVTRPWLAESALKRGRGSYRVEFNPKLMPYIVGLTEKFTSFYLHECGKINNARTIRLYESLCQFRSSGIWAVKPSWLADRYQLPQSQAENFAEMKRSFIEPALNRINEHTPLNVSYKIDTEQGGKVGKVLFSIIDAKKLAAET